MPNLLTWNVKMEDFNARCFKDINILKWEIDNIKKLKKKCETKEGFSEKLRTEMMSQYWSRCEYEFIIEKTDDNRIILRPLIGSKEFYLDVTDDTDFEWEDLLEYHVSRQIFKNKAKVDVYDQLMWHWDKFVDYCWYTRLPYERKNDKFLMER